MRQAKKEKKKILVPNSVHTRPDKENSEKNSKKIQKIEKQLSGVIFSQNGMRQDEIGGKRDKRILDPNSAHTRPGGVNSKKKQQKIQKFKKQLSGVIFSPNGMRQDEIGGKRDKRILDPNSVHTRPGGENSERKRKKIQKI